MFIEGRLMTDQWLITIDGEPVAGTNAYSRRHAIENFMGDNESDRSWPEYRQAGYSVVKVKLAK